MPTASKAKTVQPSSSASSATFKPKILANISAPAGLHFLLDVTTFYLTVDLEWVYVLENLESDKAILHGRRVYDDPKGFDKCATCISGKHMGKFEVKMGDEEDSPLLLITRPISKPYWFGWWFCCGEFGNNIDVTFADGTKIGSIVQKWGFPRVRYNVLDQHDELAMVIYPPCIGSLNGCNPNVTFSVKFMFSSPGRRALTESLANFKSQIDKTKKVEGKGKMDGSNEAYIKKCYSGCFYEIFTDSRNYKLDLPLDLPFQMKALLFSSVFLLHAIYFERG